jgi:hypothetical protein
VFEGEVTLSQKHIIGEIEVVFLVKSIELSDQEFHIFSFFVEVESIQPSFSGFWGNGHFEIGLIKPVFISLVNHFEGSDEQVMEISPFSERNLVILISISISENDSDFSRRHVMSSIDFVEFLKFVVSRMGNIGEFNRNGGGGFLRHVVFRVQSIFSGFR